MSGWLAGRGLHSQEPEREARAFRRERLHRVAGGLELKVQRLVLGCSWFRVQRSSFSPLLVSLKIVKTAAGKGSVSFLPSTIVEINLVTIQEIDRNCMK